MAAKGRRAGQQHLWPVEDLPPTPPAPPDPSPAIPRELALAIDELVASLADPQLLELPLTSDLLASAAGAALRGVLADADQAGELAGVSRAVLDHLVRGATAGRPGAPDGLAALAVYGGPLADHARAALSRPDVAAGGPDAAAGVAAVAGRATVEEALLVSFLTGEAFEIMLVIRYPGRDDRCVHVCTFDTFDGPNLVAVDYADEADDVMGELAAAEQQGIVQPRVVPVADALSAIRHALALLDDAVVDGDIEIDSDDDDDEGNDLILQRPFLEHLVATGDPSDVVLGVPTVDVSDAERRRLAAGLVERVAAERPGLAATADALAPLLIDFAADRAGDPHRWTGSTVVRFLEMATTGRIAPAEQLAELPDIMQVVVAWAHEHNGWPAEVTDDALAAVEHVRPLVMAEIEGREVTGAEAAQVLGRLMSGLDPDDPAAAQALLQLVGETSGLAGRHGGAVEPPVGGNHPEPFDGSDVPPDLVDRAATIAELASSAAADLFDTELVTLVRRATADAARHPDGTALARGRADIWASGVVYAVAQLNQIPGGWNRLSMPASELTGGLAGSTASITGKAREVRRLLGVENRRPAAAISRYVHSASVVSFGLALESMLSGLAGADDAVEIPLGQRPESDIDHGCFVLRAALLGIRPEIWRRLRVPVDATFGQLHHLLQLVFGWHDCHLHEFDVDGVSVGPTPDGGFSRVDADEDETELAELLRPGSELTYTYDFGDDWHHLIVVEEIQLDGEDREHGPWALLGGAMAGPPEDCGGPFGYGQLLKAKRSGRGARRHELAELLPPGFDPKRFDLTTLNGFVQRQGRHWDDG